MSPDSLVVAAFVAIGVALGHAGAAAQTNPATSLPATAAVVASAGSHSALVSAMAGLVDEDPDRRIQSVLDISLSGHLLAAEILEALGEERLFVSADGRSAYLRSSSQIRTLPDGKVISALPAGLESVMITNAIRSALELARATVALTGPDISQRRRAARSLQVSDDAELLPLIESALSRETAPEVIRELNIALATLRLLHGHGAERASAATALGDSDHPASRQRLSDLLRREASGDHVESDPEVRRAAAASLARIESRLQKFEWISNLFSGLSLGSILLLAALGLAITYGLMGVINMAHGEFLMVGAYVTYLVQTLFRVYLPDHFGLYVIAALPAAFLITGILGVVLGRSVLRWLHGRPLETLLTTWGVSLLLIQSCRSLFGAQNVEVENPSWLSGGWLLAGDITIPWNRVVILIFSMTVLAGVALMLTRTRAGLHIRGVTQNRAMAACTGVATDRVDMLTFGFGSGIAGLGGVALSQIGNVGPDLGQQYIVDSFMVVVLGGVGQLAGTVIAALGLGAVTKLLEPMSGAVLAKIMVLIFIILFIQKRPQGLFALRGRSAES